MTEIKKIGILTWGEDCPRLNAVICSVVLKGDQIEYESIEDIIGNGNKLFCVFWISWNVKSNGSLFRRLSKQIIGIWEIIYEEKFGCKVLFL